LQQVPTKTIDFFNQRATMSLLSNKRKLPSLNALRAFEAAARHLSFKEASDELSVSQSAVSHQIKALEEYLGFPLFTRKTRAVELTRKGQLYYPILRNAFDSIAEGTEMLLIEHSVTVMTVHVYSTFTIRWLLPRLARFQDIRPDIQVRLHTAQQNVNFKQDDVDASILIGQPTDPDVHYDYLFDAELFPVCSPEYLDKHGPFRTPDQLANHHLIQVYPSQNDWHVWLEAHEVDHLVNPETATQLESYDVALNTAARGLGIAMGQQPYMTNDLQTGSLVEIFPDKRILNPNRWYLACRADRRHQEKLAIFRSWLIAEIEADQSLSRAS
jgi:LysR family glycine cleavage system transcriptional activator